MTGNRYRKQELFQPIGEAGQRSLCAGRVLVVGCGALGSALAESFVRAGVGYVRIVDRDFVDLSNLQRQVLFDETDVREHLPKAVAAARKLRRINSSVTIEEHVADVDHTRIRELTDGIDVIVDGTDNFEIRFLINDVSLETGRPWVNGGVLGSYGQVMAIVPGRTPCLRCVVSDVPPPGTGETCDTAGVIGPAVQVVAALQVVETFKLLLGRLDEIEPVLTTVDVWKGTMRRLQLGTDLPEKLNCPACRQGERLWLSGDRGSQSTVLCGRNAVQIAPSQRDGISLEDLERRLTGSGEVLHNPFLLRLKLSSPDYEITVFRDGRAIIRGTEDLATARGLYARYLGN